MTKKPKLISSIRAKLVSAVAMLLVAMIMVVSSTYAWFTLSTAPEVTGISTKIGANGALEMALLPSSGLVSDITSTVGDSAKNATEKNITWGNLVDLSQGYGLDQITLYPSVLNVGEDGKIASSIVKFPTYGADGRPSEWAESATTGVWDTTEQGFIPNDDFGVRGVGSASGMTPRQLSYRNARSAANTAKGLAQTQAAQSLNKNGSKLADIAIEHGIGSADESYTQADVQALRNIVSDLNGVLAQIEKAYIQYIVAYAASGSGSDTVWQAVTGAVEADGATLNSIITALGGESALPESLKTAIGKYTITKANVATANTELAELSTEESATFSWDDISPAMTPLVNVSAIQVNGIEAGTITNEGNMDKLVDSVLNDGGLKVIMATGGGVYADIADQCGDYNASITISEVTYGGLTLKNMNARMETASTVATPYLTAIGAAVETAGAPSSVGADDMPITEFYGYIIDMVFRTNAAESDLLLQTDAIDRIYKDKEENNNPDDDNNTWGHGSTMSFAATDTNFTTDQVKALMSNLRVVFFNPDDGTILANAKLDMTKAFINGNSKVEAPLVLYKVETSTTYKTDASGNYLAADDSVLYYYNSADQKFYNGSDFETAAVVEEANMTGRVVVSSSETETILTGKDAVITPLTQNTATKVSALAYLDGEGLSNGSVSATQENSLVGTMNLQFSSSANLVPMDYADLNPPKASTEGGENP